VIDLLTVFPLDFSALTIHNTHMNKDMNLKKAMRNLDQQREWLGLDWVELFALIQEDPSEFSDITLRSFEIYKNHIGVE